MKNLTYWSALLLVILYGNQSDAQFNLKSISLDTFHLPLIDRKALTLNGDFAGHYSRFQHEDLDYHTRSWSLLPSIGGTFDHYLNRPDLQADVYISLQPDIQFSGSENGVSDTLISRIQFSPDFFFDGYRRKYNGKHFFETGASTQVLYFHSRSKGSNDTIETITKNWSFTPSVSVQIGFGTGRIEPISDLALALFLLQDAVEAGADPLTMTETDIHAFAQLMAQLRNERIFDSRQHIKAELKNLYLFMQDKHWTLPDDPAFFTVLTDNWFFDLSGLRQTGKRWRYLFEPGFQHRSSRGSLLMYDIRTNEDTYSGFISAEFTKYRPVDVTRDRIRTHLLRAGVIHSQDNLLNTDNKNDELELEFQNSIGRGWYPNSRTGITCEFGLDYTYSNRLKSGSLTTNLDQHSVTASLTGNGRYFISYKTYLNVNFNTYYTYSNNDQFFLDTKSNAITNRIQASLSASLVVAIF